MQHDRQGDEKKEEMKEIVTRRGRLTCAGCAVRRENILRGELDRERGPDDGEKDEQGWGRREQEEKRRRRVS